MPRTTRSVALAAALVSLLLPAVARGQMAVRHGNDPFNGQPAPMVPVSVAKAILDKDKDMALTDSQRVQLTLIQRRLDSANAPLVARLDSIRPTWRPAGGMDDLSPEQREELVTRRKAMAAVVELITPNVDRAREQVMALLRPEQRDRANKLEREARKGAERDARREMESGREAYRGQRRRGEIRDGTGRAPLG